MRKKSQISIFVLLGIVILMAIILSLIYRSNLGNQNYNKISEFNSDSNQLKFYIESCIDDSVNSGIGLLGMRGGYIFPLSKVTVTNRSKIAYFFKNSYLMPSKESIEKELATYADYTLPSCLGNYSQFEKMGYKIFQGDIHTEISIGETEVIVNVKMPLNIEKSVTTKKIPEFSRTYEVGLGKLYNIAKDITVDQLEHPNSINFGLIGNLSFKYDINLVILRENNDTILYLLSDNKSTINHFPLLFQFAHQFNELNCSEISVDADSDQLLECINKNIASIYEVQIEKIPKLEAFVDKPFIYPIKANGINLTFEDYSYLFEINHQTGVINFTPKSEQEGTYEIGISVSDQFDNEAYSTFLLNILEEK